MLSGLLALTAVVNCGVVSGILSAMTESAFRFAITDYPLAPATLYKVGGSAQLALLPETAEETLEAYAWMCGQPGPHLILGCGSNVLIADEGFPGIVLFTSGLNRVGVLDGDRWRVGGGVELDRLVRDVIVPQNYEGAGALTGIPGSVGGAIYMNAGTVNGSTCQFLESVDLATPEGPRTVDVDASLYDYRSQSFCKEDDLIVQAVFQFHRSSANQQAVYDHYTERRKEKQPEGDCCGCVFKNPENDHAGRLIEACGLKGARRGGAVISEQHANFIMNEHKATFQDIVDLIELCKSEVRSKFGVELHEEVRIIRVS